ncbi:helix-turn-helix transcriptional regulator [Flavobacterium jejuense]|uniref:Helix-turn-helix transcriptional regulator n=1 Tax=Flavobacterium jejuense TaxID=1544455 RepID=A0ABX0IV78_9FLAO|nr:TetR/AcrR family transcriptional regulator [Flavobacterium jejuense]NHN27787.1 helix-turn-helix transcriptional regulator [Flavobacterium jejuense]
MTKKQENIINAALQLFAQEGYTATSTNKVAKLAGVSEGLIFRHFTNKEGLLKAIIEEGERKVLTLFETIFKETEPKKIIQKTITLPFLIPNEELEFWKLQFKLKWELNHNNSNKLKPLQEKLIHSFKTLNYQNPELEAAYVLTFLEGLSTAIIKGTLTNRTEFQDFLIYKYQL